MAAYLHGITVTYVPTRALVAQLVKNLPAMRETWVQSLGWEDPLVLLGRTERAARAAELQLCAQAR